MKSTNAISFEGFLWCPKVAAVSLLERTAQRRFVRTKMTAVAAPASDSAADGLA